MLGSKKTTNRKWMACGELNGHVTLKGQVVTPIRLEPNISKTADIWQQSLIRPTRQSAVTTWGRSYPSDSLDSCKYCCQIGLNGLVSEIFSIKVADRQTHTETGTSTDNKSRLKLEPREPIHFMRINARPNVEDVVFNVWSSTCHKALMHAHASRRPNRLLVNDTFVQILWSEILVFRSRYCDRLAFVAICLYGMYCG